nr:uncharacterized protein LOC112025464 [Quercus suber]
MMLARPRGNVASSSQFMSVIGGSCLEAGGQTYKRVRVTVPDLSFFKEDKQGTLQPHKDALVVTVRIGGYDVKKVLVDQGSQVEIMYPNLYRELGLKPEDLDANDSPLMGFDGKMVIPRGMIKLPIQIDDVEVLVNFIVVEAFSPYTAILGRPWLHAMGVVPSTLHLKIKYPTHRGVGELVGNQAMARQCLVLAITWQSSGINPKLACHHSNVNPKAVPCKQPPRRSSDVYAKVVRAEVSKLKQAGAIKEIFYPEWLANTVIVKKKNRKWQVCTDFTDLNKACPKNPFPIPRIDQLVDAMMGHHRMSFLVAFQGYHQIPMSLTDQEKTAFHAPNGNFHYRVMPFGLKNARLTYQRIVTQMFEKQLGRNMEAYIDDIVVKSKKVEEHLADLVETFSVPREHNYWPLVESLRERSFQLKGSRGGGCVDYPRETNNRKVIATRIPNHQ